MRWRRSGRHSGLREGAERKEKMINNDYFMGHKIFNTTNHTAENLTRQVASTSKRHMAGMEGDVDPESFAAKLKQADEYAASGEHCGAEDSIAIILRQMDEPTAENPEVTKDVQHNGAHVSVTKNLMQGTTITIGGSANPDWIYVSTSVGTVKIDLNDTTSLMKCLDMFSPEDINAILKKIQEVKQAREAMREIERMQDRLFKEKPTEEQNGEDEQEKSVGEAVGVVGAEELRDSEEREEKKFLG